MLSEVCFWDAAAVGRRAAVIHSIAKAIKLTN
jgi:hypothetical protein